MLHRFFPATCPESIPQQIKSALEHVKTAANALGTDKVRVPASQVLDLLRLAPRPTSAEALAQFGKLRTSQVQSGITYLYKTKVITKVGEGRSTQRRCTVALYDFI